MLLGSLNLLFSDPVAFLALLPILLVLVGTALLLGITVHEFSHALVAHRLGDPTAQRLGRLSLNPLAHLDPAGTILLLLVGFGWGKPVPVDTRHLRQGRRGMALVAAAGPVANLAAAGLFALPIKWGAVPWSPPFSFDGHIGSGPEFLSLLLSFIVLYNLILAVFNLIPLAPLDGSNVALGVLPRPLAHVFARAATLGPIILILVVALDYATGLGVVWRVLSPVVNWLGTLFLDQRVFTR